MILKITHDTSIMSKVSTLATKKDLHIVADLKDTISRHPNCIGMSASMIGYNKQIMIVKDIINLNGFALNNQITRNLILINPKILNKSGKYITKESCLSNPGINEVERYKTIVVEYYDENFCLIKREFNDLTSQIIQHEYDHFLGKLV